MGIVAIECIASQNALLAMTSGARLRLGCHALPDREIDKSRNADSMGDDGTRNVSASASIFAKAQSENSVGVVSCGGSFVPVGNAVFKIVAGRWTRPGWVRLPSTPAYRRDARCVLARVAAAQRQRQDEKHDQQNADKHQHIARARINIADGKTRNCRKRRDARQKTRADQTH